VRRSQSFTEFDLLWFYIQLGENGNQQLDKDNRFGNEYQPKKYKEVISGL